jgi:hypothetical protein
MGIAEMMSTGTFHEQTHYTRAPYAASLHINDADETCDVMTMDALDLSDDAKKAMSQDDCGLIAGTGFDGADATGIWGMGNAKSCNNEPLRQNPSDRFSAIFEKFEHIPKESEVQYQQFSWDLEEFAQAHHSRKDMLGFSSKKASLVRDRNMLNLPNQSLSKGESARRRTINKTLTGMSHLEGKLSAYDLGRFNAGKVRDIKEAINCDVELSKSSSSLADACLDQFVAFYGKDRDAKKIIKTICFDLKDRKIAEAIYDKMTRRENDEIFATLQKTFPRAGGRGSCGACADKVETVLKSMDLQFHSYQRIKGTEPCTHIATELIPHDFNNRQEINSDNNMVFDMWWNGSNFASGFSDLNYNVFLNATYEEQRQMGVFKRRKWPITNAAPFDGTIR